jgi:hypothetical protein
MSVIDYRSGHRIGDADADENPSPERLRIRAQIAESVAHIGEDAAAKYFRERIETAKRSGIEAKERRDAEQERWNRLFDARFDQRFNQQVWPEIGQEVSDVIGETCDETLADARKEIKETVAALKADLLKEMQASMEALTSRLASTSGELPQVKNWAPQMVCYRGQLFACDGALWQARKDTATAPTHGAADWTLVARSGRDGKDGASVSVRGEWTPKDSYGPLDIVTRGGCSYIAVRQNPGRPADDGGGWMMLAGKGPQGQTGKAGPMGPKGDKGEPEPRLHSWEVDAPSYSAIGVFTDGSVLPPIELRPMFAQFQRETTE